MAGSNPACRLKACLTPDRELRYNTPSVHRAWTALAVLLCGIARGQAPSYSAAGIVNAANYAPGPFAPNSVVSLFGTNLSNNANGVSASETLGSPLPTQLANVSVYVQNLLAPVLYVSPTQINFLIPTNLLPSTAPVRVVKQSVAGPDVNIAIATAAPALFPFGNGYALAVDWANGNAIATPDQPAHGGDVVVIYLTGLGTAGNVNDTLLVPGRAAAIDHLSSLQVLLAGTPVDPIRIQYAGLTPGFAGLYQINLILPDKLGSDPELRVAVGDQSSPAGLKLAVRGSS
jgi:uncharacterized protein (TIGR03437 family)